MSSDNGHLTAEQLLLLSKAKRRMQNIELPSGIGAVSVRALSGAERDELVEFVTSAGKSTAGIRSLMAALSLCDSDGERLFQSADAEMLNATMDGADLEAIAETTRRLSRIGSDELEEVQKN